VLEVVETFCDDKAHFIFVECRLCVFAEEVNGHLGICLANVVLLNNVWSFLHYVCMEAQKHSKSYQKRVDCDAVVDDCQQICVDGCYIHNLFSVCDCSVQQSERYGWSCHYYGPRSGGNAMNDDEEFALVAQAQHRFSADNVQHIQTFGQTIGYND